MSLSSRLHVDLAVVRCLAQTAMSPYHAWNHISLRLGRLLVYLPKYGPLHPAQVAASVQFPTSPAAASQHEHEHPRPTCSTAALTEHHDGQYRQQFLWLLVNLPLLQGTRGQAAGASACPLHLVLGKHTLTDRASPHHGSSSATSSDL